jgi:putative PEP-CTERM system TPR-repeat lipoprotein
MFRSSIIVTSLVLAGLVGCRSGGSEVDLTASARSYLEKKDHRSAIIQLKNVLNQNPEAVEARVLLGQALLMDNEPAAALVELRKAQELRAPDEQVLPHLARAMLASGEDGKVIEQFGNTQLEDPAARADLLTTVATAYALRGDTGKAAEAAAAALQAKPGYVPAMVMTAQLQAASGKAVEAIAELDRALMIEPRNERAGVLRADLLWRAQKDKDGAMKGYRSVLEDNPGALGAHTALIAMLAADGKTEESRAQFAKLKAVLPDHPETLYYEAQLAFSNKEYKASREITDRLLKNLPNNVRVLELAGAAEFRMGQMLPAESFLTRALKVAPGALLARQMLAQVHLRSGQPVKALETLQPIISGKNPDGASLALAGEAWLQQGDSKKADAAYTAASKAEPDNSRVRTAVAMAQLNRGAPGAIAELESLAASDTSPRADLALISARHRAGDYAGALKAIDALEKKQPDRALAHGLRGHVLLTQKDPAGARRSFETALSKEPGYFAAAAAISSLDLAAGKPELARKRFEEFLKANPKSHQAALALAELAARTGAPVAEVTRLTQEAVRANPDNPAARLVVIEQLLNAGDPKAALVAAQEALVVIPNNPDIGEAVGRAQLASGEGQQALSTFKKLSGLQPSNPRLLIRQAEAQVLLRDVPGATESIKKALDLRPNYVPAKRAVVLLAIMDKRPADAVTAARSIQKQSPTDPLGWQLEGDAEATRKNLDAAVAAWRTALQKNKTTEYAVKVHNALLVGGKRADADRWAADWLKENANDAAFVFYLGDMAMARNDDAGAESLYRQVLAQQPSNALAMNNIAWLLVKQGKPGATPLAEKAVSLLADRPPLLDTLAMALAADNQMGKAIETQKRAVSLAPDNPALRMALARHYIKAGEKSFARAELETLRKLGDKYGGQAEVAELLKTL